jgi:hypothetical protein
MSRDYILRMIEQFGRFAAALRRRILGGETPQAELQSQLRSAAYQAGLDLELARIASLDTLMLSIAPGGELDPSRCWMCAEVLYLDGLEAQLSEDRSRAETSFAKARVLFSLVAPLGAFLVGFPEATERIQEIDARLERLDGPEDQGPPSPPRRMKSKKAARRRLRQISRVSSDCPVSPPAAPPSISSHAC